MMKVWALFLVLSTVVLIEAAPSTPDCNCFSLYDPVCSPAGKTYTNACFAKCDGVDTSTLESGECPHIQPIRGLSRRSGCYCIEVYDPVCGDGNTFSNACKAKCAGVTTIESGECPHILPIRGLEPDCNCIGLFDPVCGDGETFSNACQATCAHVNNIEAGACITILPVRDLKTTGTRRTCQCDRKYEPVCSVEGTTYSNYCVAHCYNKYDLKAGECN